MAMADGACVMALRGNIEEASATLKQADEMRTRCKANYLDLVFGRAHCQVSFFQRQLETAQQQADEMFLYHQGNGELLFHLVMFGLVGLNCQAERCGWAAPSTSSFSSAATASGQAFSRF